MENASLVMALEEAMAEPTNNYARVLEVCEEAMAACNQNDYDEMATKIEELNETLTVDMIRNEWRQPHAMRTLLQTATMVETNVRLVVHVNARNMARDNALYARIYTACAGLGSILDMGYGAPRLKRQFAEDMYEVPVFA